MAVPSVKLKIKSKRQSRWKKIKQLALMNISEVKKIHFKKILDISFTFLLSYFLMHVWKIEGTGSIHK
jgi:hypothetical protein